MIFDQRYLFVRVDKNPRRAVASYYVVGCILTLFRVPQAVMDIHAHLCTTEVMGLLGGHIEYLPGTSADPLTSSSDPSAGGRAVMRIVAALPVDCTSTGIQCEMDAVSETQARAVFSRMHLDVVGWYHSHPRVMAQPSVRDLENQSNYQVRVLLFSLLILPTSR